jgi:hypothetical protein
MRHSFIHLDLVDEAPSVHLAFAWPIRDVRKPGESSPLLSQPRSKTSTHTITMSIQSPKTLKSQFESSVGMFSAGEARCDR